mgnify:CR=1 FL=1
MTRPATPVAPLRTFADGERKGVETRTRILAVALAALGNSGTFTGTTRRLRLDIPHIRCISVQPSPPLHAVEETKHMPTSIQPGIYDADLISRRSDSNRGLEPRPL